MTFPLIQLSEDFPRDVGELPNILRIINRKGDYTWIKKNCPHAPTFFTRPIIYQNMTHLLRAKVYHGNT